jgi:apoptosis-inducing factor 2
MTRQIVILGASFAGLRVAHYLLRDTYPVTKDIKVILVSPSDYVFWPIGTVRAVVPGQLKDEDIFQPFLPGFDRYPEGSFEFVQGTAEKVDPVRNTVVADGREISYDHLVVATGTSYKDMPWKLERDFQTTTKAIHDLQSKIAAAKTIVIGGGGATGTEMAGEIAFEYNHNQKKKEITIVTTDNRLVSALPEHISKIAGKELSRLGVKVINNTRIKNAQPTSNGKTKLSLSTGGDDLIVDLYLPTIGMTVNTSFLPSPLLNGKGEVIVDEFLRVPPSTSSPSSPTNIWAVGDVTGIERKQILYAKEQALHLAKSLHNVLQGKEPIAYSTANKTFVMGVTLGRSKGVGAYGTYKIPSFIIWFLKGRHMLTPMFKDFAAGKSLA